MPKQQLNVRVSDLTRHQLDKLSANWGTTQTETLTVVIDRMYQQESKMKHIKVGEVNDLSLYAVEVDGRYYPLNEKDLDFERPDAKIYYDSGIYPGVSLTELPQYICGKASE